MPWNTGPASRGILARHAVESALAVLARGRKRYALMWNWRLPFTVLMRPHR